MEALKFLHTKGKCDLTTPSNDGLKPIHAASQCGHTNVVKVSSLSCCCSLATLESTQCVLRSDDVLDSSG